MIIAIDDSGDPGVKVSAGATTYFAISAICFQNDSEAQKASLEIAKLRQELGWKKNHEFKFRKTSPEIRKKFLKRILRADFCLSGTLLDKRVIDLARYKKDASKLYNETILKTVQNFDFQIDGAHFYIDGEGGVMYRKKVKTYFRKHLPQGAIKNFEYCNSVENDLIQMADMTVGAIRYSESGRENAMEYLKIFQKHIVSLSREL